MKRRSREINVINMSALDLFASGMGVFVLIAVIAMPYYLKTSRIDLAQLDLVIVMDTTGSMGPQIADAKDNMVRIVRVFKKLAPKFSCGFIAYRDHAEEYVTRAFPLTPMDDAGFARLEAFVSGLSASGGGDFPEAVDVALEEATLMPWREKSRRVIVIIGDAPPHDESTGRVLATAGGFHGGNEHRRVSVIYTAAGDARAPPIEAYFRRLAIAGGGDFITDKGALLESLLLTTLGDTSG